MKVCKIEGCIAKVHARGWCRIHYLRWWRRGDALCGPKRRYMTDAGYILLRKRGHPNADCNGRIPEHRFLMSEYLGRPLLKSEIVHHLNGQRDDNRLENLVLLSKSDHQRLHETGTDRKERMATAAKKVRDLCGVGMSQAEMGRNLGVSRQYIHILMRRMKADQKTP